MGERIDLDETIRKLNGMPKEELIFPLKFSVESIHYDSNVIIGVKYFGKDVLIKTIQFNGNYCNLEKGDWFIAHILKYHVQKRERGSGLIVEGHHFIDEYYFPRDFEESEVVKRIDKIEKGGMEEILATFGS